MDAINDLYSSHLRIPVLKSAEFDDNRDNLVDRIEINMLMPLLPNEKVYRVSAIISHDIEVREKAKYKFDSVSSVSYESSLPLESVYIDGDIRLRQSWPMDVKGG